MQRLLWLFAACLISGSLAFGQGTVTEQSPVTSGAQPKTLHTNPNGNGTVPQPEEGRAVQNPSTPSQELPGNSNPANATTGGGEANGQAIRPNSSQSGTPGSAEGRIRRGGVGRNPVNGSIQTPNTNRGTFNVGKWLWIALAFTAGLVVIGLLASRRRLREELDSRNPSSRITTIRGDEQRHDDQIRKTG